MKFFNFTHLLISTIFFLVSFNYVAGSVESCITMRVLDNENSLNEWENLHSFFIGDARAQVNMTKRNLHSINQELFNKSNVGSVIIMDLSINKISSIENGTFERFHNLRILMMRVNSLREITASQFKGLMMLEDLDLSLNTIHLIERDALRHMERLQTIDLSGNCLFNLRPYIFFRNVRLVNINFNRNFLDSLPILMPFSQRIDNLNVTANRFTNLTSLMYYDNIQSLDVSHNPLREQMNEEGGVRGNSDESTSSDSSSGDENNYTMRLNYNINEHIHRRHRRYDNRDGFSIDDDGRKYGRMKHNGRMNGRISEVETLINEIPEMQQMKAQNDILQKLIRSQRSPQHYMQLSFHEMQQLHELKRINRLEYFTCRNCSLHSLDFLLQYSKLKYVDVKCNMIKSVDATRLTSLEHIEYLDLSKNNVFESISLPKLLKAWPSFNTLILNDNRGLKCEQIKRMQMMANHLNKTFRLEVNACT